MIDTIKIQLLNVGIEKLDYIKKHIKVEREMRYPNNDIIVTVGHYNNFWVTVGYDSVSIAGSIAKYYTKGNNLIEMSLEDLQDAFGNLGKDLGLDLSQALIRRIDIARNFYTRLQPEAYFNILGDKNYMKREIMSGSLYYKTGAKQICFYNKGKEQKIKDPKINILRMELRLTSFSQVRKCLKLDKLEFLLNSEYYNRLAKLLQTEYDGIHKYTDDVDLWSWSITSLKDFRLYLESHGLRGLGGANNVSSTIKTLVNPVNQAYVYKLRSRCRDHVQEIKSKEPAASGGASLSKELDDLMNKNSSKNVSTSASSVFNYSLTLGRPREKEKDSNSD